MNSGRAGFFALFRGGLRKKTIRPAWRPVCPFLIFAALLCWTWAGQPDLARAETAERIIALGSPPVEILCALGLRDKIIARGAWDVWPPAVRALPHVGDPGSPNLELILHLRPDLVLADLNYFQLARRLEKYAIKVVLISAFNTPDVIPAVRQVAAELGREEAGRELCSDLRAILDLVQNRLADLPTEALPTGLALTGRDTYYSFSDKGGWRFLDLAGARNLCAGMEQEFPLISREWMALAKPDFVLISPYNLDYQEDEMNGALRQTWRSNTDKGPLRLLESVRQGRLIVLDDLLTFGPRSVLGVLYLAKQLHPDKFTDIDPQRVHADFLQKYFQVQIRHRYIYP